MKAGIKPGIVRWNRERPGRDAASPEKTAEWKPGPARPARSGRRDSRASMPDKAMPPWRPAQGTGPHWRSLAANRKEEAMQPALDQQDLRLPRNRESLDPRIRESSCGVPLSFPIPRLSASIGPGPVSPPSPPALLLHIRPAGSPAREGPAAVADPRRAALRRGRRNGSRTRRRPIHRLVLREEAD